MITVSSELLQGWIVSLLWPLTRVLGLIAIAPVLSHSAVPRRVRLGLGVALTLMLMPMLPPLPKVDPFSYESFLIMAQQMLIGLAIGFAMRMIFAAIELAGYIISMTMGLGFATFFDPQSHGQTTAISQFLSILAILIFLSLNGHLIYVSVLTQSFTVIPVGQGGMVDAYKLVSWGEMIFRYGLVLALPVLTTLLITNMALGILTRTAPQLNLFGIGFPVTIMMGFVVLTLALAGMATPIQNMIEEGTTHMLQIMP